MPAIHLGGSGWSLVRQWPEHAVHEPWQEHLRQLLRGHMLCRELHMQADGHRIERLFIDWSHPGIGKPRQPAWERTTAKGKGSPVARFSVQGSTVDFLASGSRRGGNTSTSITVAGVAPSAVNSALALDAPVRACIETAAAAAIVCMSVWQLMEWLPLLPPHEGGTGGPSAGVRGGESTEDRNALRESLESMEPFHAKVLELICGGWTNAEIASQTRMSVGSVRAATSAIYARLGVRNRHEAAARAAEHLRAGSTRLRR